MPLWTLLGLMQGKQTAPWPLAEGSDGQTGFLACRDITRHFAPKFAKRVPMFARPAPSQCARRMKKADGWMSITAVAWSVSFARRRVQRKQWRRRRIGRSERDDVKISSGELRPPRRRLRLVRAGADFGGA
jgi:hypothetical protein